MSGAARGVHVLLSICPEYRRSAGRGGQRSRQGSKVTVRRGRRRLEGPPRSRRHVLARFDGLDSGRQTALQEKPFVFLLPNIGAEEKKKKKLSRFRSSSQSGPRAVAPPPSPVPRRRAPLRSVPLQGPDPARVHKKDLFTRWRLHPPPPRGPPDPEPLGAL